MTTHTTQFADYVRQAATAAGYDISGPRSGGRLALARDTGMSHASTCRMLAGKTIPEARFLHAVAAALDVPVGRLFELAGLVPDGTFTRPQAPVLEPLSPRQAAQRLGIRDRRSLAMFAALVDALRAEEVRTP